MSSPSAAPSRTRLWAGRILGGLPALLLLTGCLGGAVATHVRVGAPVFETIFQVVFGVLLWAGLWLREARLRALLPLR